MFGKLFRSFRGGARTGEVRTPSSVADLLPGDLLTFKPRRTLPAEMQGASYEVASIATYQYEDGLYMQLTLIAEDRSKLHLGFSPNEPNGELCFSKPLSRSQALTIFDEQHFASLWDDGYSKLSVVERPEQLTSWLANSYDQMKNQAVAYYFESDVRNDVVSNREDDSSEELRYHECAGSEDQFGLTVEVWGDGETDITLDITCQADVIETIFPAA